jgi:predicted nucleotidyltransferase
MPSVETIAAAIETVLARSPDTDAVSAYLFGSVAEGRSHRESDIDLALLLRRESHPDPTDRFDRRLLLMGDLEAELGRTVDLVILNDAPPLLGRHAVRGRRLLCRDEAADFDYVLGVQLRAADLEPWLKRMRKLQLESLRR